MKGKNGLLVLGLAVLLGILNVLVLKGFEFLVNDGTDYIWNDVFNTDVNRWGVVPLAAGLSLMLSALFVWTKQSRLVKPKVNLLADDEDEDEATPTLKSIGVILLIGLASLLAGASLGPEATLMAVSSGVGVWLANRNQMEAPLAKLLKAASIGALLVAFLGSMVMALLPLLLMWQKKQLRLTTALPGLVASGAAFGTLWLMDPKTEGWGDIPAGPHYSAVDFAVALLVGVAAAGLGWLLKRFILSAYARIKPMEKRWSWPLLAGGLGLVVGLLYLAGGESIQFNGAAGTGLLLNQAPAYGLGAMLVILVCKLLATGWSLASGYRGGLVFPSIYMGVVLALMAGSLFESTGPGVMLGGIAGILGALTGPAGALIFILALIPIKLIGVALAGIAGAAIGNQLIARLDPTHQPGKT